MTWIALGAVHNLTYDGFTVRSRAPPVAPPLWMGVPPAEAPAFAGMTVVMHRTRWG